MIKYIKNLSIDAKVAWILWIIVLLSLSIAYKLNPDAVISMFKNWPIF